MTAINSHPNRKVVTDPAAGTSSIAATNTGRTANGTPPRCSRRHNRSRSITHRNGDRAGQRHEEAAERI